MANLRELSKQNFTINDGKTIEHLNSGSLQRIADATELMARRYTEVIDSANYYKGRYNQKCENEIKLEKKISALKGVITKLKKKAKC